MNNSYPKLPCALLYRDPQGHPGNQHCRDEHHVRASPFNPPVLLSSWNAQLTHPPPLLATWEQRSARRAPDFKWSWQRHRLQEGGADIAGEIMYRLLMCCTLFAFVQCSRRGVCSGQWQIKAEHVRPH